MVDGINMKNEMKRCIITCAGEKGNIEIEICIDKKTGEITTTKRINSKCIETIK